MGPRAPDEDHIGSRHLTDQAIELRERVSRIAHGARNAAFALASASSAIRDRALRRMAEALRDSRGHILEANARDVSAARERGTADAMVDRLLLDEARIEKMAASLEEVAHLPDPLGRTDSGWTRPNGLQVARKRIPLGVVGIIYEARPNVTSDAAGLCLKSGNAVVLKGGSEAHASNGAIIEALREGVAEAKLPPEILGFIDVTDRAAVRCMLELDDAIDLIIPRGGEGLIRFVSENARMPVIKHYKGVCHVFLERTADVDMAVDIILNAKVQRPSVCNAAETLLIDAPDAERLLVPVARALLAEGVTLHVCERSRAVLAEASVGGADDQTIVRATEDDWGHEYLSLDLAVRVVDDLELAVAHIRTYGSDHTEAIVTKDYAAAERFVQAVDSSTVLVNASTRFADGGQLGLGAEIGISTTKLHAFGPMGLRELTTTKFVVHGQGQTRA